MKPPIECTEPATLNDKRCGTGHSLQPHSIRESIHSSLVNLQGHHEGGWAGSLGCAAKTPAVGDLRRNCESEYVNFTHRNCGLTLAMSNNQRCQLTAWRQEKANLCHMKMDRESEC